MAEPTEALTAAPPADTVAYKRMTDSERVIILKLHEEGITQTVIAQRLGRAQSSVSEVIQAFEDTTDLAARYFDSKALQMAENIVENGLPRDHVAALAGRGKVLKKEQGGSGLTIQIGIKDSEVTFASSHT